MAEFWEQQMMDRILDFGFKMRHSEKQVIHKEEIKAIIDYTKFLIKDAIEYDREIYPKSFGRK